MIPENSPLKKKICTLKFLKPFSSNDTVMQRQATDGEKIQDTSDKRTVLETLYMKNS